MIEKIEYYTNRINATGVGYFPTDLPMVIDKLNEIIEAVNYLSKEVRILNAREGHRTLDQFPTKH